MKYLSLLEKLKVLLDMLLSFKFILIFVIIMLILTILYLFKKISNKKYIIFMSLSIIVTFIISIIKNYKILSNTFDNFATIFFSGIYFPSIYVYIGILFIIMLSKEKQIIWICMTSSIRLLLRSLLLLMSKDLETSDILKYNKCTIEIISGL